MSDADILFSPIELAGLRLRNRFVMAPMTRNFAHNGVPSEGAVRYYARRAEAQVGLIVTEGVGVDHPAAIGRETMGDCFAPVLHGAEAMDGWRKIVDAVHEAGGLMIPQLWHQGAIRVPGSGPHPAAASARPSGIWGPAGNTMVSPDYLKLVFTPTNPLSDSEIADIISAFGRSAANAYAVGFDGVALHGAHGYLIDSFLWRHTNLRADRWGGDAMDRAGFAAAVVRAVRAATSPDFPIVFRFSQWKLQDYDAKNVDSPAELEAMLGPLVDAGVNVFDASTRIFSAPAFAESHMGLAGWIKRVTGLPTIAVGGVGLSRDLQSSFSQPTSMTNNLDLVAERVARGEFDLIGVGRALLMDGEWVQKVRDGRPVAPFRLEAYATLE